ncbi:MAG: hypothetical protein KDA84_24630, partial [Planctomycetaceae bacterium]|nr:hypothetical protein [Planctomycetaceae bacterium]
LDGPQSWLGLFAAVLVSGYCDERGQKDSNPPQKWPLRSLAWTLSFGGIAGAVAMWLGTSVVLGLMSWGYLLFACPLWNKSQKQNGSHRALAYWLLAAWFVGLFLATPLYTPYPRLSLPWLVAAWIASAAVLTSPPIQNLLSGQASWQPKPLGRGVLVALLLVTVSGVTIRIFTNQNPFFPWQDRTGLERVATRIQTLVTQKVGRESVIYVYAEPGLFYHLARVRRDDGYAGPVANLQFSERPASIPVLLVVGPHAQRSPAFQKEWEMVQSRFELLGRFPYLPSDLVLLNQHSATEIENPDFQPEQSIHLYLVSPP